MHRVCLKAREQFMTAAIDVHVRHTMSIYWCDDKTRVWTLPLLSLLRSDNGPARLAQFWPRKLNYGQRAEDSEYSCGEQHQPAGCCI